MQWCEEFFSKETNFHQNDEISSKWWIFIKKPIFIEAMSFNQSGQLSLKLRTLINVIDFHQSDELPSKGITLFIKDNHFHKSFTFSSNQWNFIRMISFNYKWWIFIKAMNFHQCDEFSSKLWIFIKVVNFNSKWLILSTYISKQVMNVHQSNEISSYHQFVIKVMNFHQNGELS